MRYEHVPFHTGLLGHACQAGTYGGSVAGAKVSVNDSETVRPVIDHLLWFHSGYPEVETGGRGGVTMIWPGETEVGQG